MPIHKFTRGTADDSNEQKREDLIRVVMSYKSKKLAFDEFHKFHMTMSVRFCLSYKPFKRDLLIAFDMYIISKSKRPHC